MKAETFILKEDEEQAAKAIATALEFLRREAEDIGMIEASQLIDNARRKAEEWSASRASTGS